MKKIITLCVLIFATSSVFAATSIKAEVNGMVCAFCAKGIEKKLKALPEQQSTYVNLKNKIVVLELKANQNVPIERFKTIIQEAGYTVNKVETVEKSAEDLRLLIEKGE